MFRRYAIVVTLAVLAAHAGAGRAVAQQQADRSFDTRVARPAFGGRPLRVAIDEAHHNFHTMTGRYQPFADLLRSDGCEVVAGKANFTPASLRGLGLLVISNALGHEAMDDSGASHPAFTPAECSAVVAWVREGGALLLIADHSPMGAAARPLGEALGVDMRCSYTIDPRQKAGGSPSIIAYRPGLGLAVDHPIARGRDTGEALHRVVTFTGQSLLGPPGSTALLRLSDQAEDLMVGLGEAGRNVPKSQRRSAAGRAQGLAFELGRGRVVVLGEAAMMTAHVSGWRRTRIGMNVPDCDDRQFALNVVRWLGRAL